MRRFELGAPLEGQNRGECERIFAPYRVESEPYLTLPLNFDLHQISTINCHSDLTKPTR